MILARKIICTILAFGACNFTSTVQAEMTVVPISLTATAASKAGVVNDIQLKEFSVMKEQGKKLFLAGKYVEAEKVFSQLFIAQKEILGEKHPDTLLSMSNLAVVYSNLGHYRDAMELDQKLVTLRMEVLGEKHPETLTSMNNLAVVYSNLGRYRDAMELDQKLVALRIEVLGEKHLDTLSSMGDLAVDYSNLGRYQDAMELNQKIVALRMEVLGEKHPDTLTGMSHLAVDYRRLGRNQDAMELDQKIVALRMEVLGEKHPDTLRSMSDLALDYSNLVRYRDAMELDRKIVALRRQVLGEKHLDTLTSMSNLAVDYHDLGRNQDAMELDQKIVALRRQVLGEKHPDTLTSMSHLAVDYRRLARYKDAVELDQKIVTLRSEVSGEKHPDTLSSMSNLAVAYSNLGRYQDAMELDQKIVALRREVLGEKHPDTLSSMNNLAVVYSKLGRYQDALELDQMIVALRKEISGEKHPNTLSSMSNLAVAYSNLGRYQDAMELDQKIVALRREILGEMHPDTLTSMSNLAAAYSKLGCYQDAMELDQKIVALRREVSGETHPDTLSSMSNLAVAYSKLGCYQNAMELDQKILALRQEVLGTKHPDTLSSMNNLAVDYSNLGHYQEAVEIEQKIVALKREVLGEKHPDTLISMSNLASAYSSLSRNQDAIELDQKLVTLRMEVLGEKHPDTLTSMNNLAIAYEKVGAGEKAVSLYREMLLGYEDQRVAYKNLSKNMRQMWFSQVVPNYKNAVQCLVQQGHVDEAFKAIELCKARGLIEQYAETLADSSGILSSAELQKINSFQQELAAYNTNIAMETSKGNTNQKQNLIQARDQLGEQYQTYQNELQQKYQKYAELSRPEIVNTQQGEKILPSNTTFLNFLQHGRHIEVFILSKEKGLNALDLVMPDDLERGCKIYHELLSYKGPADMKCGGGKYLWQMPDQTYLITENGEAPENGAALINDLKKYKELQQRLAENLGKILLEPLAVYLPINGSWLISPDGDLDTIPFETLIYQGKPAVETADISYIQSLSMLKLLQKRQQQNEQLDENRKDLFAMGNALYGDYSEDEAKKSRQETVRLADTTRSGNFSTLSKIDVSLIKWENLPGTAAEINQVAAIFPEVQRDVYMSQEATENRLKCLNQTGDLKQYKYLLFATHGIFFPQVAELSSIVLGRQTQTELEGYVTVSKWMGYNLRSELVYLSACESGLGKEQDGEGMIGLPYALCIAGNQDTVMSLWKINDVAAAQFSTEFFQKLYEGMGPLKALSATKRTFIRSTRKEFSDPSVWSAFLLYGI